MTTPEQSLEASIEKIGPLSTLQRIDGKMDSFEEIRDNKMFDPERIEQTISAYNRLKQVLPPRALAHQPTDEQWRLVTDSMRNETTDLDGVVQRNANFLMLIPLYADNSVGALQEQVGMQTEELCERPRS